MLTAEYRYFMVVMFAERMMASPMRVSTTPTHLSVSILFFIIRNIVVSYLKR